MRQRGFVRFASGCLRCRVCVFRVLEKYYGVTNLRYWYCYFPGIFI